MRRTSRSAATAAVDAFLGRGGDRRSSRRDATNLTVGYSGLADRLDLSADDPALRQPLRGRRRRRSCSSSARSCAGWRRSAGRPGPRRGRPTARATRSGTIRSSPGCSTLADDVRGDLRRRRVCTKNLATLKNLVAYSADWSDWMGFQHPGENGQWPHLDALWAAVDIDLVGFDNYLPLSDWTTGERRSRRRQLAGAGAVGAWPPSSPTHERARA